MGILKHKKHIIKLFNLGVLKLTDADFYYSKGYCFDLADGKVINIYKENENV